MRPRPSRTSELAYGQRHHKELLQARALPEKLVRRLDALRAPRLLHPQQYEIAWQSTIDSWNDAAEKKRWLTLPRLCAVCGTSVIGRKAVALENGAFELSNTCSDKCRGTAKKRRQRDQ